MLDGYGFCNNSGSVAAIRRLSEIAHFIQQTFRYASLKYLGVVTSGFNNADAASSLAL